jgi:hypothetical protein
MKKLFTSFLLGILSLTVFAAGHVVTITSQTNVSCYGGNNGTATASVSGGVGPFSFSWSPSGGTSNTAVNLSAGSYTLTVTDDSDGSVATTSVTITQPSQLVTTVSNSGPICPGNAATLYSATSGGTAGYTYLWSPASGLSSTTTATTTAFPTITTTYTLTATDANGCTFTSATTVVVNAMPVVTATSITICSGSAGTITASGATTYSWTPSTGLSSSTGATVTANPLTTTTYTVTGTSSTGCVATATATVTVNAAPVVTVNSPSICAGQPAVLTASGATTYNWNTGATSNPYTVIPASTTTYTVQGSSGGCTGTAIATVTVNATGTAGINYGASTFCQSATDPTPTISGTTGGTFTSSPAGLVINSSTGTIDLSASALNTYTVTYTTGGPCPGTTTASITVTTSPSATFSYAGPYCNSGTANPTFPAGSSAGTFSSTAGLVFTNVNTGQINLSASTSGTYTVNNIIASSGGCSATSSTATITINPGPNVTLSPTSATCGACNGSITVSAPGGTTFAWNGPAGYTSATINPTGLCAGTYTLYATNAGCSTTTTTTVTNASPVVSTIGSVTPASCGACNGSATVFATGGTSPYTYSWAPGGGTTPTASGLCAGTYTVTVTDNNGCTHNSIATISNSSPITGTVSSAPTACGVCNGSANVTISGGTGPYTYNWSPGTPAGDGTVSISALCVGTYTVIATDANGCTYTGYSTINSSNPVYVTATANPSTCGACNGLVVVTPTGGVSPYLFDLSNGSPQQTSGNFTGVCGGVYVATVTDVNGCSGIYTINVPVSNSGSFSVTNIIQNESGYGLHNGSIDLTVSGSAPPYTFLWSNGATTEDIYSLAGGNYTVTITDNNGDCGTYTFTVSTLYSYGYITGYLYNDNNTNCMYDAGDVPLYGYYVSVTNGTNTYYGYTNSSGFYSIWVPATNYTITPYNSANIESACTSSYSVSVTSGSTSANNNFAYSIPPIYDVCVATFTTGIVPGFNGYYYVNLHNYGNQSANGVLYFVLPAALNYTSSSPSPSSVSGDTIFWNYSGLAAYSSQYYYIYFYTPPSLVLGTPMISYTNATVTNGTDINPACNYNVYTRVVTGSFDPNEKTVSPAGENATGDILLSEEEFTYLIRFQNTGSGPAVNINVTDTLSSLLDPLSFQMLNSSHNYVVEMMPGNVIKWKFDNIMLPDSTTDEAGSHGHVQFKINKLNTPIAGQVIQNKAYIYFDFNEPVITNTAINTYVLATNVDEQINDNGNVKVYPNPFSESTTFVIQSDKLNETYSFEMTDVLGKKVRSINNVSEKQFTISRSGLENGMYFYNITNSNGVVGKGKVIIK